MDMVSRKVDEVGITHRLSGLHTLVLVSAAEKSTARLSRAEVQVMNSGFWAESDRKSPVALESRWSAAARHQQNLGWKR
ncbi:MAG: hypothetical protein ACKOJF_31065, partial [Planctomycetaceae bacterium]